MSKTPKPKGAAAGAGDTADEKHHKYRCRDLKRQLEELEEYNEVLAVKLLRSQKRLRRMKIERNILLERFEGSRRYSARHADDSDSDSDAPLKNNFPHAASDLDAAESASAAATPTASSFATPGRARRRAPGAQKPRSSAGTPQPSSRPSPPAPSAAQNTSRRARSDKDPKAPRRPANAFVLYCQVERPNIRSRGTDLTYGEMTKAMGAKWKLLSQSEKKKYFDLYEREMSRYQQELETYKGGGGPAAAAPAENGLESTPPENGARTEDGASGRSESPPSAAPAAEAAGIDMDVDVDPDVEAEAEADADEGSGVDDANMADDHEDPPKHSADADADADADAAAAASPVAPPPSSPPPDDHSDAMSADGKALANPAAS
ncbi:non-histone protein [Coemansia sp. Benny D115]|nr:non-histone protein [Coemansia sp. Benny D115]